MSFEKPSFEKPSSELSKAEVMARVEQIREAELEGYMASRVEKSEELRGVEFPRLSRLATIGALSEEVINQLDISDEEKGFLQFIADNAEDRLKVEAELSLLKGETWEREDPKKSGT